MTKSAAQLLRSSRRSRGWSQRTLTDHAKTSGSLVADVERSAHDPGLGSLERLLEVTGYRLCAIPTSSSPVSIWADVIYRELQSKRASERVAFRALIGVSDDLTNAPKAIRVALCVSPPAPCGDQRFDAALAGIVEHHLTKDRLPVPEWVQDSDRFLEQVWEATPFNAQSEVPRALARHGVWISEDDLASV